MFSTAPNVNLPGSGGSYGAGLSAETLPMHGLGYGLPLSRLYVRYFKGDIQIASVDGYGTDVYVYLQRLSHMAQENLLCSMLCPVPSSRIAPHRSRTGQIRRKYSDKRLYRL